MDTALTAPATARYAQCIAASRKVRWDIDHDVIRGRKFDFARKFLPDGLAMMQRFAFATPTERRFLSQVQGRTYAAIFGLVERFIAAKMLDVSRSHAMGDQVVLESLVRFTDEELKHQELFRRLEAMMAAGMPAGYRAVGDPDKVAAMVLTKSNWAVLALTCHIELFVVDHYRQSIDRDTEVSELWKDVFLFHMKEESQHAILDELEWRRENARLSPQARDAAVGELIDLVAAVDGLLQAQAAADAEYFSGAIGRTLDFEESQALLTGLRRAYRWQYIVSGAGNERFQALLAEMLTPAQLQRVSDALGPIVADATAA